MNYTISVRALCEFTAKAGDLDLRFTPAPTALQGVAGHTTVTGRRDENYEKEVALVGDYHNLHVRGRADGFDPARGRLEEIKTFRGDLARMPVNHRALHWAQLKIYGHLLCRQRGLATIELALIYFDIDSQRETTLTEIATAAALNDFFEEHAARFQAWAAQELAHAAVRDEGLRALRFPHAEFRAGQRELAEAVYKAASTGRDLLAQAPTGIGKTLGTLFPLLKALAGGKLDRVFFLAAKTPGRALALSTLERLQRDRQLPLRTLELVARDKACEYPDRACHGDACPLAKGFYDRLAGARAAALQHSFLDRQRVRETSLAHQVCPYYLSQELARWCDIVVGDYNYYFDHGALLYSLMAANQWRAGVLVDEAHNLIERARGMYSATLHLHDLTQALIDVPAPTKKALTRVRRTWRALIAEQESDYRIYPQLPPTLLQALQSAVAVIGDHSAEHSSALPNSLLTFYFDAMQFCRLSESFDSHSLIDITTPDVARARRVKTSTLCIRNIVPAPFLRPRFEGARSTTLFSATLSPGPFYRDMLGVPANAAWVNIASPFRPEQLAVFVADHISTRFAQRQHSLEPIVALMGETFRQRRGNYLAFFSSFDYLDAVATRFAQQCVDIPIWRQSRQMGEATRRQFLERFTHDGEGIGFAVLGGAFGEGIDLPGDELIGAFIATLGLPPTNPVNEAIKARLQQRFGQGYDYAYLFPGLQKIVQAAGRVIRTTEDRGVIHLIDDRFAQPSVQRLLPPWWQIGRI